MLLYRQYERRWVWLSVALILPLLYLYQLVPHTHATPQHTRPHEMPEPHGHHFHAHDHAHDHARDHEAPDPPQERGPDTHHHHSLAKHLDSHDFAKLQRPATGDPELLADLACVANDRSSLTAVISAPDGRDRPPDTVLLDLAGPRAPPRQG